ncbi:MAG TPA: alpha-ketoglutarate-dependent dioxygenase AlkB [Leptospiraceae bacterium]|nr:alpha-ketoglutarate-dependent dioxygenase AlkB [Leptospiraceae bacterium]HMY67360.1 alpha-ketoglutarate-dependent dioxygenase AlkB [Leptospiraceae bacterium]HMZ59794.1 alpha-ketoglutarate-dependent dioxygenase AlkB [Leptospiraceae bacterium]HNF12474.1 alpha-ketoglutarate-dependent dioxygenase AlkB [Leptospiraceae bacterium]HNF25041.1 alpha-ketoglutarate-dependent dioxygenase AlkB [Leptospiraceae bacterium]
MTRTEILSGEQGSLIYCPGFFSTQDSGKFFKNLQTEIRWQENEITLFGKKIKEPRLTAFLGNEGIKYKYSGSLRSAEKWTDTLLEIKQKSENEFNSEFNCVLCNLYRNGQDSMGWHSDDEKELGADPIILSLSFGAERKFLLKEKEGRNRISLNLKSGDALFMGRGIQRNWKHCIPKSIKSTERISLTFRAVCMK